MAAVGLVLSENAWRKVTIGGVIQPLANVFMHPTLTAQENVVVTTDWAANAPTTALMAIHATRIHVSVTNVLLNAQIRNADLTDAGAIAHQAA